ncbi:MAG: GNAT family N-acetyltransferase [Promethearchaeota archaeon]
MALEFRIRKVKNSDLNDVLSIYNYYILNCFAAYSEKEVKINFINHLSQECLSFVVLEIEKKIVGFAFIKNYLSYDNFKHTGQLSYFIKPEYTNKGFGTTLFNELIDYANENGIRLLFVHLSSLNEQSLNFHKKHGFIECGRFKDIAKKFGQIFDIIWMQRSL